VTDKEWLECADPEPMLEFLRGRSSDRKLRLFAAGCCRLFWKQIWREQSRRVIEVYEQYLDKAATWSEVTTAMADSRSYHKDSRAETLLQTLTAGHEATCVEPKNQYGNEVAAQMVRHCGLHQRKPAVLLRCIFGHQFRPILFVDPSWLTPTVKALGLAIYTERSFADLPVLADALEEAGCGNADILNHCRQPGEHARGCWVVDLLLGKE
jgi:hypothetical protein